MTPTETAEILELLHGYGMSKEEIATIHFCSVSVIENLDKEIMTYHTVLNRYMEVLVKESKINNHV